ncbi:hypothetical protein TI39_contig511g00003 [Zymoseptoria brevis]|uniref:F-box domain-containing protein n=1 Tax=Zymoseptoria brevis TaxID=1047168 RepID=A0A0F4GIU6_9PEZI|nr:hypothetical protein TI39_contig511g00003 [Zymoseptoria brevis]
MDHTTLAQSAQDSMTERIERTCMRKLRLSTSLSANLHKCHQQHRSPLYSIIPKELRDLIFEYATAPEEDASRAYKKTDYWCRPRDTAPLIVHTSLLLTCRRAYLESNALPFKGFVVRFYFSEERGPPQVQQKLARSLITGRTTPQSLHHIDTVVLTIQMYVAMDMFREQSVVADMLRDIRPRSLRVVIKHTDWWYWEDGDALQFQVEWLQRLLDAPYLACLETFRLELEALERNKDQLKPIVDNLLTKVSAPRRHPSSPPDSPHTQLTIDRTTSPKISHWTGPANINDETHSVYEDLTVLHYRVEVLTWKSQIVPTPIALSSIAESAAPMPAPTLSRSPSTYSWTTAMRLAHPDYRSLYPRAFYVETQLQLAAEDSEVADLLAERLLTEHDSALKVEAEMEDRRKLWRRGMAALERKILTERWAMEGSLLEFEEDEVDLEETGEEVMPDEEDMSSEGWDEEDRRHRRWGTRESDSGEDFVEHWEDEDEDMHGEDEDEDMHDEDEDDDSDSEDMKYGEMDDEDIEA